MPNWWFGLSATAFVMASVFLLVSAWVFYRLLKEILPWVVETQENIRSLGNIASHTLDSTVQSMSLIENQVSQTMGNLQEGSHSAQQKAVGVGTIVAGVYAIFQLFGIFKGQRRKRKVEIQKAKQKRKFLFFR